jgi:hypothetical protein
MSEKRISEAGRFDEALSRRLAKLSSMPVDTSSLERAVRGEIGVPENRWARLWRPLSAVAAGLMLVAIVGLALLQNRPAQASADLMMQLHRDMVAGTVPAMQVESMAEVNEAFAAFGQEGIRVAAPAEMQVMKCCLQNVANRQVACILVKDGNVPVTLTVADLDALKPLGSAPVMHKGEAFHVQAGGGAGDLTMVTVDRGGHRICLIGALSAERLMALTDGLDFGAKR